MKQNPAPENLIWTERRVEFIIRSLPRQLKAHIRQNDKDLALGYYEPHKAMKTWAELASSSTDYRMVPDTYFFSFLFELIARHAFFTKRSHINKIGWRADCLRAMARMLERKNVGEGVLAREQLTRFVSGLIDTCITPPKQTIDSPLFDLYFSVEKQQLRESAFKFLSNVPPEKPGSNVDVPDELWTLAGYLVRPTILADIPKRLIKTALWLDLRLQSELMSRVLNERQPLYDRVCSFLYHVGDLEWCRLADSRFNVFNWHRSLVSMIDAKKAQSASQNRRPGAVRRGSDTVKLHGVKQFVAPKHDIFKNAAHPSSVKLLD
jgi:hypothetical protein